MRREITIDAEFDIDIRADYLNVDKLAELVSESLVKSIEGEEMDNINPIVRVYDGRQVGEYPVKVGV